MIQFQPVLAAFKASQDRLNSQETIVNPTGNPKPNDSLKSEKKGGQTPQMSPWVYASEGTQLAIIILLGLYVGYKFDLWKGTQPWGMVTGAFLGIFLGLYSFLRRFLR